MEEGPAERRLAGTDEKGALTLRFRYEQSSIRQRGNAGP